MLQHSRDCDHTVGVAYYSKPGHLLEPRVLETRLCVQHQTAGAWLWQAPNKDEESVSGCGHSAFLIVPVRGKSKAGAGLR